MGGLLQVSKRGADLLFYLHTSQGSFCTDVTVDHNPRHMHGCQSSLKYWPNRDSLAISANRRKNLPTSCATYRNYDILKHKLYDSQFSVELQESSD